MESRPLRVYFSAHESHSPNGNIVRYEWDLDGDGAFESDATQSGGYVSQLYTKPGRRTVSLRVMDEQGRYNTASAEIEIRHPAASSVDYWTIFDQDEVKRIDLILTQANWDAMWANPSSKTEVPAGAILLGQRVEGIGLGDNQRLITLLALAAGVALIGLARLLRRRDADVNLHLTIASQNPHKVDLEQVRAERVASFFPFRATRSSKYVEGMERVCGW